MARSNTAVVAVELPLVGSIDRCRRIVYWAVFDFLTVDVEIHQLVPPIDCLCRPWRDQHFLPGPPVLRVDQQVVDAPIGVLDEEILNVADLAVERVDMVSGDGCNAAEMRILVLSLCTDHAFLTPPGFQ